MNSNLFHTQTTLFSLAEIAFITPENTVTLLEGESEEITLSVADDFVLARRVSISVTYENSSGMQVFLFCAMRL